MAAPVVPIVRLGVDKVIEPMVPEPVVNFAEVVAVTEPPAV